ncbi:MAG TPA: hypothetical protein VFZ31_14240 [Vicinamibacterales bacterium]
MTSIRKVALACMTAVMVTISVNANAQGPANQDTFFTFSQAVELPKTTLPAGTYFFQLMDSQSNRHIVKVMSQDRKQLFATLLAIPYYSTDRPSDEPQVRFLETPAANGVAASNAIKIWFYPGTSVGHEFIWPRDKAMQLARSTGQSVLTTKTDEESSDLTRVDAAGVEAAVTANEREASVQASASTTTTEQTTTAQATTTQPEPEPVREQVGALATPPAEPAPAPERVEEPAAAAPVADRTERTDLPNTAGMLPLLALIGIGSLVGSRMLRRRSLR